MQNNQGGNEMDVGVIIALAGFGLTALLAVLMGIVAAISAVSGVAGTNEDD